VASTVCLTVLGGAPPPAAPPPPPRVNTQVLEHTSGGVSVLVDTTFDATRKSLIRPDGSYSGMLQKKGGYLKTTWQQRWWGQGKIHMANNVIGIVSETRLWS
jgi:hypothetical protein